MHVGLARRHVLPDFVGDPAGVGDRWVDHVRRDAQVGELEGGGHRVVGLCCLRRTVGDLVGEPQLTTRGEADDPSPPGLPSPVSARELGDQQGRCQRVDGELLAPGTVADGREGATETIPGPGSEGVLNPAGRVVDQDVDRPQLLFGDVEQPRGGRWVAEVGFDGNRRAAEGDDVAHDTSRVVGAVPPVRVRQSRVGRVLDPQVAAQDAGTVSRQLHRGGCADPVVCPRHYRHVRPGRRHDSGSSHQQPERRLSGTSRAPSV
jgi:hypothetical protein